MENNPLRLMPHEGLTHSRRSADGAGETKGQSGLFICLSVVLFRYFLGWGLGVFFNYICLVITGKERGSGP